MESVPCHPQWLNMSSDLIWPFFSVADQSFESKCYQFQSLNLALKLSLFYLFQCVSFTALLSTVTKWMNRVYSIISASLSLSSLTLHAIDRGASTFFTLDLRGRQRALTFFSKLTTVLILTSLVALCLINLKWKTNINNDIDRYTEGGKLIGGLL